MKIKSLSGADLRIAHGQLSAFNHGIIERIDGSSVIGTTKNDGLFVTGIQYKFSFKDSRWNDTDLDGLTVLNQHLEEDPETNVIVVRDVYDALFKMRYKHVDRVWYLNGDGVSDCERRGMKADYICQY